MERWIGREAEIIEIILLVYNKILKEYILTIEYRVSRRVSVLRSNYPSIPGGTRPVGRHGIIRRRGVA